MRSWSYALATVVFLSTACASDPRIASGQVGTLDQEISESSALVRSTVDGDLFWTLNDSGNAPVLYAVSLDGSMQGRVRILGVENVDWEAMTVDGAGNLYIADIGNNANSRRDMVIHVIEEPPPRGSREVRVLRSIPFSFPDQERFPDEAKMNFDAESIFWWQGKLYIISKHRSDTRAGLYELDPESAVVTKLDETEMGSMVTDAAVSRGGELAVLTYLGIRFYDISNGVSFASPIGTVAFVPEVSKQSEAISWSDGSIVFTNEQRDVHYLDAVLERRPEIYPSKPPRSRSISRTGRSGS